MPSAIITFDITPKNNSVLIEAILEDYESLKSHHIYMAGDFLEMQRAKRHFCAERGAKLAYVYGDAFSYKQ